MGLVMSHDINTGIEMDGMYFRVDRISCNDTHFQVVATGYASEEAYREGKMPISEPRAYDLMNYNKADISQVFAYAYEVLKMHPVFKQSDDVLEKGQSKRNVLEKTEIISGENGMELVGNKISRKKIYEEEV